jgi:predicted nucleic acid-binding Zn ribbon protein
VVGRTREQLDDGSPTYPTLAYGAVERWEPYRLLAWEVGAAEIVRRGGPALRTTSDALLPFANPDDRTRSRIIAALAEPSSHWCVGCGKQIRGRIDRKWCTEACRKKTTRTASRDATRRKGRGRPRALRDREVSPRGVVQMTRRNRSKEQ